MTHKEIERRVSAIASTLASHGDFFELLGMIEALQSDLRHTALESEPEPLAEGWLCGIEYGDDEWDSPTAIQHATFSRKRPGWAGEKYVSITERQP